MAISILVAWLRVASVSTGQPDHAPYTWDTALSEVRAEFAATVAGLRHERDLQRGRYVKMRNDTRVLDQKLGGSSLGG